MMVNWTTAGDSESFSPYWVVEPGANIEVNVTGFMRMYAGYSYRWMMGLNLENTSAIGI